MPKANYLIYKIILGWIIKDYGIHSIVDLTTVNYELEANRLIINKNIWNMRHYGNDSIHLSPFRRSDNIFVGSGNFFAV